MIDLADIDFIGSGLKRPECVLAHSSGLLIVPDWTGAGGVSLVAPHGGSIDILPVTVRKMIRCGQTELPWKAVAMFCWPTLEMKPVACSGCARTGRQKPYWMKWTGKNCRRAIS